MHDLADFFAYVRFGPQQSTLCLFSFNNLVLFLSTSEVGFKAPFLTALTNVHFIFGTLEITPNKKSLNGKKNYFWETTG